MLETITHLGVNQRAQSNDSGASSSGPDISFFTAEFTNSDIERQFRQRDEKTIARHAAIALMIAAILNLLFGYNDYIILGLGAKFWLLLSARVTTLLLGAVGATMILRRPNLSTSGKIITALEIVFQICFTLVVMLRPTGLQWHVMMMVVITLAYYMFVPNRFIYMATMGLSAMMTISKSCWCARILRFMKESVPAVTV